MASIGVTPTPHGRQQQRPVVFGQDKVTERGGDGETVAHPGVLVEPGGDLALRRRRSTDALDGDAPLRAARGARKAVLAYLPCTVGQLDLDADVLARAEGARRAAVGAAQDEGDGVGGLLPTLGDLHLMPDLALARTGALVQAGLDGDQRVGHQPVDLVPGGCDLLGDGLAEDITDG